MTKREYDQYLYHLAPFATGQHDGHSAPCHLLQPIPMIKLLFDTRYVLSESEEFRTTWCMSRALEWSQWPLFVLQPVVPLALVYMPTEWVWLIIALFALSWLWVGVRTLFVSLPLAQFAFVFVRIKWFTAIVAGAYLAYLHHYEAAGLAAIWPVVTGVLRSLTPSTNLSALQQLFAKRILVLAPQI